MFILPRMVRILMEGLLPLSEAIKKYLNAKYPDRDDLYIGLDIAVAVGNPAIISTAPAANANLGLYRVCPPRVMKSCHLATLPTWR